MPIKKTRDTEMLMFRGLVFCKSRLINYLANILLFINDSCPLHVWFKKIKKKPVNESIIIDKPTHGTDGDAVSSPNSALQLKQ